MTTFSNLRVGPSLKKRQFDEHALLARDRSMVGANQLLAGELVNARGDAFGEPARVDEDDRRAMLTDQLQHARVDRGPDTVGRLATLILDRDPGHVFDRDLHAHVHGLQPSGVDDRDLAVAAYRAWGFGNLSNEMIAVLNRWAAFVYGPLLDNRSRLIQERRQPGADGRSLVDDVHRDIRRLGGIGPAPRHEGLRARHQPRGRSDRPPPAVDVSLTVKPFTEQIPVVRLGV